MNIGRDGEFTPSSFYTDALHGRLEVLSSDDEEDGRRGVTSGYEIAPYFPAEPSQTHWFYIR